MLSLAKGLVVALGFLFIAVALGTPAGAQGSRDVLWVRIDGVIGEGTALHVRDAIEEAERRNAPLVLELNTPGGLVDSTLDIDLAVASAKVPVLAFVGPASAFAASAGTFILLMGQPTGMAQSTSIGSAQPITVAPDGSTQPADDKVANFLVGRIRAIAERTGRDADTAERFVTENLNLNRTEAKRLNMVDILEDDVESFVRAAHGMTARTATGSVTLDTQNARLVPHERGVLAGIVDILSNPQIAFILILVGTYALIFGLANPGTYVPETIGALLLLLGLIGLGLFTTSTAGILLLLLAIVFFVAEVFTPTQGILSAAGVVALVFAVVFLVDEPLLPSGTQRTFYFAGIALAVLSGGTAFFAATIAVKTRRAPARDSLIGKRVVVVEDLAPEGRVSVFGEIWSARTDGPTLTAGTEATITAREGLRLVVEAAKPPEPAATR